MKKINSSDIIFIDIQNKFVAFLTYLIGYNRFDSKLSKPKWSDMDHSVDKLTINDPQLPPAADRNYSREYRS